MGNLFSSWLVPGLMALMPLKIQTCQSHEKGCKGWRPLQCAWLDLDCQVLLMNSIWSAICNFGFIFLRVFFPDFLKFPLILGFVVGGVYNSVP